MRRFIECQTTRGQWFLLNIDQVKTVQPDPESASHCKVVCLGDEPGKDLVYTVNHSYQAIKESLL